MSNDTDSPMSPIQHEMRHEIFTTKKICRYHDQCKLEGEKILTCLYSTGSEANICPKYEK